ncbi:Sodium-coupled monocarboxylate transporter 2 [Armadillidium nasatum]|uniref:Sodium-coupled monocarboxylate transporter 2 n=1 Tax=Armadillidium nasatum TaxID=96803 RepID=A0A5N5SIH9_9CRUS|nr:Sodium-coupled monocarboxylate transporter 2 [Armadillidium nasatum]
MLLIYTNANVFVGVCLYATSSALAAVAPFDYTTCILVMGIVCTIYSTVGGIRAVVWTDVFQLIVMTIGMLIYVIAGVIQIGGIGNLFNIAEEGKRLEFFNMNPSIYERHNFYNTIAFGVFFYGTTFGVSQINTQRICAVRTLQDARKVLIYTFVGFVFLQILIFSGGLVTYASYAGCDPVLDGKIEKHNQVLSHFIVDKLGHMIGLPGIFTATLISSTLSTVPFSSVVNAQVALIWRDLLMKFKIFSQASPLQSSIINKILTFICGAIFIAMAFLTAKTESIIQLTSSVSGILIGLIFGIFMLGLCFPRSNRKGAWTGIIVSSIFLLWIYIGALKYGKSPNILPLSTEVCPIDMISNKTFAGSNDTIAGNEMDFNGTRSILFQNKGNHSGTQKEER